VAPIFARRFLRKLSSACVVALLLLTCRAQDPLRRYPQNYQLVFENEKISVIHVHYGPYEHVPVHDHSDYATLFIYLNDCGPVRFRMEGVPPTTMVRPAVSLGAFRYSPGRVERHSVQSLSEQSSDFLRIELKQFPLQGGEAFRHGAPASLNDNRDEKEFSNDLIDVERVVCMPGSHCRIAAVSEPSLIVALSDVRLERPSEGKEETLSAGRQLWANAHEAVSISAKSSAPAHLLRVVIKSPRTFAPVS
jgi:hypothetical protein